MAKSQKRSNREMKKPKSDKSAKVPPASESSFGKNLLSQAGKPKKEKNKK
jgi:hypothetical protein